MNVALLSPMPPERNGIADYARQFSDALKARGTEIVLPLADATLHSRADAARWVDACCWDRVDVVHTQFGGGRVSEFLALEALATKRWASGRRPLLTATVHDPERLVWHPLRRTWSVLEGSGAVQRYASQLFAVSSDPFTLRAERRLASALDGIVTLTATGAASLSRRLRIARDRVTVIGHGTPEIEAAALPPAEPLRLLYFGFIYRGKGIEDLLEAFARVHALLPGMRGHIRLTLSGGTAPAVAYASGSDYLGELRRRIAILGLEHAIDWKLDVPADEIPAVIQSHHAVVLPYRESRKLSVLGKMRGTSGALAWAVACGRGVITSDARSFAEEICTGNGICYPQGDVRELAACIAMLVRVPETALAWSSAAGRLAEQRAWPRTAQHFEQCFLRWQGVAA